MKATLVLFAKRCNKTINSAIHLNALLKKYYKEETEEKSISSSF